MSVLRIALALDHVARFSGRVVAWLIVPMVLSLCYEVVARYVFNAPTQWAYDMTFMLYGTFFTPGQRRRRLGQRFVAAERGAIHQWRNSGFGMEWIGPWRDLRQRGGRQQQRGQQGSELGMHETSRQRTMGRRSNTPRHRSGAGVAARSARQAAQARKVRGGRNRPSGARGSIATDAVAGGSASCISASATEVGAA